MTKTQAIRNLMDITNLFIKSGVCPLESRDFSSWFSFVRFCHDKGYLYAGFDEHGRVDFAAVAYRVPEEPTENKLPLNESGTMLFVPVMASKSTDKFKPTKMIKHYLSNNPDVDTIYYHYRADLNKPRKFKLRRIDVGTKEALAS